jgi:alpha-1,2-mannosyltransferase
VPEVTAAATRRPGARPRPGPPRAAVAVVLAVATGTALALRLYQLTRPGFLLGVSEYDDGVYLGSALDLARGILPYRDYALVQPPGITVLMAPLGLLARAAGSAWAMAAARIATCCAGAASVPLTGMLARPYGLAAVTIASGLTAVYPAAITASHTLLLEPWLVLGCLIGAMAAFRDRRLAPARRLAWGGAAFGAAAVIKGWAVVPALIIAVLCLPEARRAAAFLAGSAAGFAVPAAPFAAAAPAAFLRDVVTDQLTRASAGGAGLAARLSSLAGLSDFSLGRGTVLAVAALLAVAIAAGWAALRAAAGRLVPLEWFVLASTAAITAMFCWASDFYYHYPAFFCPFLALALAMPVGTLAGRPGRRGRARRPGVHPAATAVAAVALAAMAATGFRVIASWTPATVHPWGKVWIPPASLVRHIPPGACVVTDSSSLTIAAGRFTPGSPGCPVIVDSYGRLLTLTGGRALSATAAALPAFALPAVSGAWQSTFGRAGYVWLSNVWYRRVPAVSLGYLRQHFRLVARAHGSSLYARRS